MDGELQSTSEIISYLSQMGFSTTSRQIATWHRARLLPEPIKRALGRGRGSVSLYPRGTSQQAEAICKAFTVKRMRSMQSVGAHLWWEGYDVPTKFVRTELECLASDVEAILVELLPAPDDVLDKFDKERLRSKSLTKLRSNFKAGESALFSDVVMAMVKLAKGGPGDLDANERRAFEEVLAPLEILGSSKNDESILNAPFFVLGDSHDFEAKLQCLSDDELLKFRQQSKQLGSLITGLLHLLEFLSTDKTGRRSAQALSAISSEVWASNTPLTLFLWVRVALKGVMPESQIEELLNLCAVLDQALANYEITNMIAAALPPAVRKFVLSALSNPAKLQDATTKARLAEIGRQHRSVISAVLETPRSFNC